MPNVHAMPRTADIIDDRCCARHDEAGRRSALNGWQHDQDARLLLCKWDDRHRKAFAAMHAGPDVMVISAAPSISRRATGNSSDTVRHSANTASLAGRRNQMGHSLAMRASCLGCKKIIRWGL